MAATNDLLLKAFFYLAHARAHVSLALRKKEIEGKKRDRVKGREKKERNDCTGEVAQREEELICDAAARVGSIYHEKCYVKNEIAPDAGDEIFNYRRVR